MSSAGGRPLQAANSQQPKRSRKFYAIRGSNSLTMESIITEQEPKMEKIRTQIASGDMRAFEELVLAHQQQVLNLAFRLLGDPVTAEDIAQDVFVKAWEAASSFRGDAEIGTWLYRITVNLVSNYWRKRKWERLLPFGEKEEHWKFTADAADRPDLIAEKNEQQEIIHQALLKLPEEQRLPLVLHRWEGISYKEIAEITGSSLAAVESRIHRAKRKLAKILSQMLEREVSGSNS